MADQRDVDPIRAFVEFLARKPSLQATAILDALADHDQSGDGGFDWKQADSIAVRAMMYADRCSRAGELVDIDAAPKRTRKKKAGVDHA